MAELVLGLGTSHSPLLSIPPGLWPAWAQFRDHDSVDLLDLTGAPRSYDELLAMAPPGLSAEITPERMAQRYSACQRAIARVERALFDARPDVLVVIGDDQQEIYDASNTPALSIYAGREILNKGLTSSADLPDHVRYGRSGAAGQHDRTVPGAAELATHLVRDLSLRGFDPAVSSALPPGRGIGHAFGFVFNRLYHHRSLPTLPILINCYYPPNQPTPHRCRQIGAGLRAGIESWEVDARVAVMGSGGWSHFVVDEEIDRAALDALCQGDLDGLAAMPEKRMQSGTSEIRNWIVAAAAFSGMTPEWIDYIPCYRTAAGTGLGAAFGVWRPQPAEEGDPS